MNVSEHAKILKAYIDRLSTKDLKNILYDVHICWEEQNNGNAASQDAADKALHASILNIIGHMLTHDRDNISLIISNTLNRKG